jgi:hypothetical protein
MRSVEIVGGPLFENCHTTTGDSDPDLLNEMIEVRVEERREERGETRRQAEGAGG